MLFDVFLLELPTGIIDLLFLTCVAFLWVFFDWPNVRSIDFPKK